MIAGSLRIWSDEWKVMSEGIIHSSLVTHHVLSTAMKHTHSFEDLGTLNTIKEDNGKHQGWYYNIAWLLQINHHSLDSIFFFKKFDAVRSYNYSRERDDVIF